MADTYEIAYASSIADNYIDYLNDRYNKLIEEATALEDEIKTHNTTIEEATRNNGVLRVMVKFINNVNKAFPIDSARSDVGIIEKMIDTNITTINRAIVLRDTVNNVLEDIKNAINAIEPLICDGSVLRAMFNKI